MEAATHRHNTCRALRCAGNVKPIRDESTLCGVRQSQHTALALRLVTYQVHADHAQATVIVDDACWH